MAADTPTGDRRIDVRDIEGEPFGDIVDALGALEAGETLLLIADFEPVPLYDVLEARGFTHDTTQVDEAEYHVAIEHA